METLVMYASSSDTPMFCLKKDWEKEKKKLHGRIDYMMFRVKGKNPLAISRKIQECLSGSACPVSGGHLCLK